MKEVIEKISNYNLFNYLLPGVIFSYIVTAITNYKIVQTDIVVGLFFYYFIGLVISRFGSLIIEPILKKTKFVIFVDYKDYLIVSEKDENLSVLSETNNMYRTFITTFFLIIILKLLSIIENRFTSIKEWNVWCVLIFLFFLFLFAYRKRDRYIIWGKLLILQKKLCYHTTKY